MRHWLDQVSLGAGVSKGFVLLIDVGGPGPLGAALFPRQRLLDYIKQEEASRAGR